MNSHPQLAAQAAAPDKNRRLLLAGVLSGYVCSFLTLPFSAALADAPDAIAAKAPENFLALSRMLTGKAQLDAQQADRLYAALVATTPDFNAQLKQFEDFIANNPPVLATLQATLDEQKLAFAKLPGKIVSAWYIGVVGSGKAARCITYESSLMFVAVADRLRPPSYAYGPYGSWGRNPLAV